MNSNLSSKELAELILTYGTHKKGEKRPLSPIETAKKIKELLDSGKTKREITSMLATNKRRPTSKDTSMVNIFLKILTLPHEYHDQISFGKEYKKIGIWIAYEVTKVKEKTAIKELLDQIYIYDLNKREVINAVQYYKKDFKLSKKVSMKEIVQNIIKQRTKVIEKEVLIGKIHPKIIKKINKVKNKDLILLKKSLVNMLRTDIKTGEIFEINLRSNFFYIIVNEDFKIGLYGKCNKSEKEIVRYINQIFEKHINR